MTQADDHASSEEATARMVQAVEEVQRAVEDLGHAPGYHREVMARHRQEWPIMWARLDRLFDALTALESGEPEGGQDA